MKKTAQKNLIISADDFGKNEKINKNIIELLHLGKIDRVEIFALGGFSPSQIDQLKKSGVKLDLHLTTGDFLNERTGVLLRLFIFLARLLGTSSPKKIEGEWQNQIKNFQKLFGRKPDGLSSHEHIHYFPLYFKVATRLAKKNGIEFIRYGRRGTLEKNNLISFILDSLSAFTLIGRLKTTDYLLSLDWLKNKKNLLDYIPEEGTTELVCHFDRDDEYRLIKNL